MFIYYTSALCIIRLDSRYLYLLSHLSFSFFKFNLMYLFLFFAIGFLCVALTMLELIL